MNKETFTHEQAVLGMAGLMLTIITTVESMRQTNETRTTEAILDQYHITRQQLAKILSRKYFADIDEADGRVHFATNIDPRVMGFYDERAKTFRWSNRGLRQVLLIMGEAGRYPADFVVRRFIGNENPVEILKKAKK